MSKNPLLRGVRSVRTGRVDLPVDEEVLDVLVVEPESDGPWPTILLIHENQGLVPYMIDVAEAMAEAGYRVVAPDLMTRIGGTAAHIDDRATTTRTIESETHVADLVAVYDWLAAEASSITVVGFCFGAEMGWRLITERTPDSAVLYYGIGPDPGAAADIRCPVYAVYAQDDPRVNDTLAELFEAMSNAKIHFVLESYPGTKHAFHDHTRPERYHAAAAAVVWDRTLAYLDEDR